VLDTGWKCAQTALTKRHRDSSSVQPHRGCRSTAELGLSGPVCTLVYKYSHKKKVRKGDLGGMAEGKGSKGLRKHEHPLGKKKVLAKALGPV